MRISSLCSLIDGIGLQNMIAVSDPLSIQQIKSFVYWRGPFSFASMGSPTNIIFESNLKIQVSIFSSLGRDVLSISKELLVAGFIAIYKIILRG